MTIEFRSRPVELRAEGRQLSGVVMPYNERALMPWGGERFEPGAFQPLGDVKLNLQHQRTTLLTRTGAGLELIDGPDALRMMAALARHDGGAWMRLNLSGPSVLAGAYPLNSAPVQERLENGDRVVGAGGTFRRWHR